MLHDSKKIWEVINWNGKGDYDPIADKHFPTSADLATQFLTKGDRHDPIDFSCIPNSQYNEIVDSDITFDEIDDASRLLKEKSTSDGWCPQMITSIKNTIFPVMIIIFNAILQCVFFPTKWCLTVVAAIFKHIGSPRYAKYYRPVSLVQLLYKWFDFILLTRFKVWFCIATMYRKTESVIFQKDEYSVFEMLSGIKQGIPMSPLLVFALY